MAASGRVNRTSGATPVALMRIGLLAFILVTWEIVAAAGWFYRDVVPSLTKIAAAIVGLLMEPAYYRHLGITAFEVFVAVVIGGFCALLAGVLLGSNRFLSKAFEPYIYYLGPTPKIVFFPIMLMWFGVGPTSKIAMGTVSAFFPVALAVAAAMREIDKVLIRVGHSFRANSWQMVTKIYLPAMRIPILSGLRLGFGVALIGTLLAEIKLSNQGLGYLIIQAYNQFNMPRMYAILIILFALAIAVNWAMDRIAASLARR